MPEFEDIVTTAFPTDVRRITLFFSFLKWFAGLQTLGITGTLWVDGSFVTKKPSPDDIDCYLFNAATTRNLNATEQIQLQKLLDHDEARAIFNLDLYFENPTPDMLLHRQAYWSGFFGFQHDRSKAKGFVELTV